jgi:hypothetical protein
VLAEALGACSERFGRPERGDLRRMVLQVSRQVVAPHRDRFDHVAIDIDDPESISHVGLAG